MVEMTLDERISALQAALTRARDIGISSADKRELPKKAHGSRGDWSFGAARGKGPCQKYQTKRKS